MAMIIINNIEYEIEDNSAIADVCRQAGVPFDCNAGVCGSCVIKVEEGAENLSELDVDELDLGMDDNTRLACKCKIKTGIVKATF